MALDGPAPTKFCPDCRQDLPLAASTKNVRNRDGLSFYCATCARIRVIESRRRRLGPPRTRNAEGPRDAQDGHKWCPECEKHFDAMVAEQGGLCAICREAPAEQVDHDHRTNRVRGLLCFNCNGALGQFRDRPDLMLRAVLYLGRNVADSLDYPDLQVGFAVGA
jgi:hypothetical protein